MSLAPPRLIEIVNRSLSNGGVPSLLSIRGSVCAEKKDSRLSSLELCEPHSIFSMWQNYTSNSQLDQFQGLIFRYSAQGDCTNQVNLFLIIYIITSYTYIFTLSKCFPSQKRKEKQSSSTNLTNRALASTSHMQKLIFSAC